MVLLAHHLLFICQLSLSPSVDNGSKSFGPRSGQTKMSDLSGSKPFDTVMVSLKEIFEIVDFEKNSADDKTGKISQHAKNSNV